MHGTLSISLQCTYEVLAWNTDPCPKCLGRHSYSVSHKIASISAISVSGIGVCNPDYFSDFFALFSATLPGCARINFI